MEKTNERTRNCAVLGISVCDIILANRNLTERSLNDTKR